MRNTALLGLIIFGADLLNHILTIINLPQATAALNADLPLPTWAIMLMHHRPDTSRWAASWRASP